MIFTKTVEEAAKILNTDIVSGLSEEEAKKRLTAEGANELAEKKPKSKLAMFVGQLNDPMIYILFGAAAISLWQREVADAVIILIVVLLKPKSWVLWKTKASA